jgi:hypothetical protein
MKILNKLTFTILTSIFITPVIADTTVPVEVQITNADKWPSNLTVSLEITKTTGNLGNPFWLSTQTFHLTNGKTAGTNKYSFYFEQPNTPELNGSFTFTYAAISTINPTEKITGTYTIQITNNQLEVIDNWDRLDERHLCEFEADVDFNLKPPLPPSPEIHISCLNVPPPLNNLK